MLKLTKLAHGIKIHGDLSTNDKQAGRVLAKVKARNSPEIKPLKKHNLKVNEHGL